MIYDIEEIENNRFVLHKKVDGKYKYEIVDYKDYSYIKDPNGKKMRYLRDDVFVSKSYENLDGFESDISKIKKFMLDKNIFCYETVEKFKILAFDIEVLDDKIVLISFYSEDFKKVLSLKPCDLEYVECVENEKAILKRFIEIIKDFDPDIIIGYNSDMFDLPFIEKKMKKYGFDINEICRLGKCKKFRINNELSFHISGRLHLDVYRMVVFLDSVNAIKLQRFRLEEVYESIIGNKKKKLYQQDMEKIWKSGDIKEFVKYNLEDSIACYEICIHFLQLFVEISKITGLSLFITTRNNTSKLIEFYLMKNSKKYDTLIPFKPKFREKTQRESETYVGGYVKEPVPGIYENIISLDYRSLYPSIIVTHNVDVYTLDKCECCKDNKSPSGHWFCKNIKTLISGEIRNLLMKRFEIKRQLKEKYSKELDERQRAIKTLANAIYGYLGYSNARWYSRECAESVTFWGREYINRAIKFFEDHGYNVIYADTDGFLIENANKEEILKLLEEFNSQIPEFMELEYDGFYIRGLFISKREVESGAKKKYVLVDEKGNLKIRGFELVRRNVSNIAKKIQEEIIKIVLIENNPKKAKEFLNKVLENIRNYNFDLDDFVIYTQLTKSISKYKSIPPHVAALKRSKRKYKPGDIIGYVVLKGKGRISDRSVLIEDFDGDLTKIDINYYIEHQILPSIKPILYEIEKQNQLTKWF